MLEMKSTLFTSIVVLTLAGSLQAQGIYIEVKNSDSSGVETSRLYIGADRLRAESAGTGEDSTIIFREDRDVLWIIDNQANVYQEMTRQSLEAMKSQMENAMAMMAEQMKNMPPERRAMMEKMMGQGGGMPMSPPEKTTYKKASTGEKIKGWTCTRYEGFVGGTKTEDVWTVDWRQVGIDASDLSVMQAFGSFFEALAPDESFFQFGSEEFERNGGYSGAPVKTIVYEGGAVSHTSEVELIENRALEPTLFELPQGVRKGETSFGPR